MIKLGRIGEKVEGVSIDITVKGNKGHVLAPTWELVMGLKRNEIDWEEYERKYLELLNERLKTRKEEFIKIIEMAKKENIFLCCFCRDEKKCHRTLAKNFLESLI